MLIPHFWAEAKLRHRQSGRQLTLQRWGWSSRSQDDAQAMAADRVRQAMDEAIAQWDRPVILRREPKVPYNGADGVPVREEIVDEREDGVVTRNSYGALCLNVADCLFVDVDQDRLEVLPHGAAMAVARPAAALALVAAVAVLAGPGGLGSALKVFALGFVAMWVPAFWGWHAWRSIRLARAGGALGLARTALQDRVAVHPEEAWRLYRTPRGARILALHARFAPREESTRALMAALHADPLYARMCRVQDSFRARVSPKPWRMPAMDPLRGPVWPVEGPALARRQAWVAAYDARQQAFASCEFIEQLGTGSIDPKAARIARWHDALAQAQSGKPLA